MEGTTNFSVRSLAGAVVVCCEQHTGYKDEIKDWESSKPSHYQRTKYLANEICNLAELEKNDKIPLSSLHTIAAIISEHLDNTNVYFFKKDKLLAPFRTGATHSMNIYHDLTIIVEGHRKLQQAKKDSTIDQSEVSKSLAQFRSTKHQPAGSFIALGVPKRTSAAVGLSKYSDGDDGDDTPHHSKSKKVKASEKETFGKKSVSPRSSSTDREAKQIEHAITTHPADDLDDSKSKSIPSCRFSR